jgi:aminoglycoside phosphotransferase family enzyme
VTSLITDGRANSQPAQPEPPAAEVRETSTSVVLLMAAGPNKAKKSVDLEFLDFREVEARGLACQREVELNRMLAPDVYLGGPKCSTPPAMPANGSW